MTHIVTSQAKESVGSCKWSISEAFFLTHDQPSYQTPEFPVPLFPGCMWFVEVYPNGSKDDNRENVSLYFHCSVNQTLIAYVSFTTEGSGYEENFTYVFEEQNTHGQGYPVYMSHDELLNYRNGHISDGKVTFVCNVKFVSINEPPVLLNNNTHYLKDQAAAKFLPQLLQQYGDEMSDCCLKVGDEEFKTYRLILSIYSPVFKTMFTVPMEENRKGVVNVVDFTADTVKTAINFFYTCEIEVIESSEQLEELFRFADKYDIAALKEYLENESISKLSTENVCMLLEISVRSNAFVLKDVCSSFLEECIMIGVSVQGLEELDSGILKDVVVSAMKKRQNVTNASIQNPGNVAAEVAADSKNNSDQ